MDFKLSLFDQSLMQKQATDEVLECNDVTADYGLMLTQSQAMALVETRFQALKKTGRVEFGGGAIDKIIYAFYDSPYIMAETYEETIHDLIEMFYYYKNETFEIISDDQLIDFMKTAFNGICQGSLAYLSDHELAHLAGAIRFGRSLDNKEESKDDDEEMEYE